MVGEGKCSTITVVSNIRTDWLDIMLDVLNQFYRFVVPIFMTDKESENYFSYKSMDIKGFKGLTNVSLNFSRNDLVLLLGLNESGKTSILKAIECFDFNNDPEPDQLKTFLPL